MKMYTYRFHSVLIFVNKKKNYYFGYIQKEIQNRSLEKKL